MPHHNSNTCNFKEHPCNNSDSVKLTDNNDYNIFFNIVNGIVYLKGENKLIKLNNNFAINTSCNNTCNTSSNNTCSPDNCTSFKLIGYFNSKEDLYRCITSDLQNGTIAIVNECNINYIYVYVTENMNNLIKGWNKVSKLVDGVCNIPQNNIHSNTLINDTLINPVLLRNGKLFDSDKFNRENSSLYLPNKFYFLTYENYVNNCNDKIDIEDFYKIKKSGDYIVEYNFSWYFSLGNVDRYPDSKTISSTDCIDNSTESGYFSENNDIDDDINDNGVMFMIIKVVNNVIHIIYSSIKNQKGHTFPSNMTQKFKHNFEINSYVLFLIYNLHTCRNVLFNVLIDECFMSLKQLN